MYFPIGWPKILKTPELIDNNIIQVVCNRDKILFVVLTDDTISIWFAKPCVLIVYNKRSYESLERLGKNAFVEWKPDSSMLAVVTVGGHLILYNVGFTQEISRGGVYQQSDPPQASLRRDSAELFIREVIPALTLNQFMILSPWRGRIACMACISALDILLATERGHLVRYRWDGTVCDTECALDLSRVAFYYGGMHGGNALPAPDNAFVIDMEYSPLIGGFAIVMNDGRAAFLTGSVMRFEPSQVQGMWAMDIDDATCVSVNHKYRLIAFGRKNSTSTVFTIDEQTGQLELSHHLRLGAKDWGYGLGPVRAMSVTPDGCATALTWQSGGLSVWSTFGALLMCTLAWDYGLIENTVNVISMDWSIEGYQLYMVRWQELKQDSQTTNTNIKTGVTSLLQLDFVKSLLTVNPCMSQHAHLYLQGDEKLYINLCENLTRAPMDMTINDDIYDMQINNGATTTYIGVMPSESKQWLIVPIPSQYSATNWPIRCTAVDSAGLHVAVAGRYGFAIYTMITRKWKLFGNETQEKDFVVTGGLLWWKDYVVMGSYSILKNNHEVRLYPRDSKLDNRFLTTLQMQTQVMVINSIGDSLVVFCGDGIINIYKMAASEPGGIVNITRLQEVDITALCVHPACVISVALTRLRAESFSRKNFHDKNRTQGFEQNANVEYAYDALDTMHLTQNMSSDGRVVRPVETMVINVSGRLIMVQREVTMDQTGDYNTIGSRAVYTCSPPTVLASCVENAWAPATFRPDKPHLTEALWLYCGSHGMRVWLPIFPRAGDRAQHHHTFMSKRIMLPFQLKIYPLAILFEDAIILGAENDTTLYSSDSNSAFSLPFCILERTSQVYLHQILRQLIRRNLGYHAYEIAISCTNLPYFPHSLELLLHEVLEEEATCKEPIPDAQLPSIIEFIQEFPVYLQTVVQCARKTEIALWPCLFSVAGKPKELFKQCMSRQQLDTAASYLIILQNLEPSSVSRQFATLLLDTALEKSKWELSRDLVRFLRAIDPNDIESPRTSFILPSKFGLGQQSPPVIPNAEELSLILGTMQVARGRSFSTTLSPKVQIDGGNVNVASANKQTVTSNAVPLKKPNVPMKVSIPSVSPNNAENSQRKKSVSSMKNDKDNITPAEHFFIDLILQRHARRLLSCRQLTQLGQLSAFLDLPLVRWLNKERDRAARLECFVMALKGLHEEFEWPKPVHNIRKENFLPKDCMQSQQSILNNKTDLKILNTEYSLSHLNNRPNSLSLIQTHAKVEGDSGYMSYSGGFHTIGTPVNSDETISGILTSPQHLPGAYNDIVCSYPNQKNQNVEAKLISQEYASICSEQMSQVNEDLSLQTPEVDMCYNTVLESLSNQTQTKGSQKAEVQLRYLLQMFTEAGCLEWSLIIAILLQDAMAVLRTGNAAKSIEQTAENVCRLRDGLNSICKWAQSECLGYVSFTLAIQNQVSVLTRLLSIKLAHQKNLNSDKPISGVGQTHTAITEQSTNNTDNVRKNHDSSSPRSQSRVSTTDIANSIHGSQGTTKNSIRSTHTQYSFNNVNRQFCENTIGECDNNISESNKVDVSNNENQDGLGCVIC